MVEANPDDDGWGDDQDEDGGWDDWEDNEADFEEPALNRQGSSFDNAMEIYSTRKRKDITFVEASKIRQLLNNRVEMLIDQMGVSEDLARAMLLKNEWNHDLAIKNFCENPNYIKETFGFELGDAMIQTEGEVLCPVCFCDYDVSECTFLPDCGHGLCNYCFEGYLTSKAGDGVESVLSVCPDQKCGMIIPERLFQQFLPQALCERYQDFLIKSFVDLSKQARWCPGRDCIMAVEYKAAEAIDVHCDNCSKAFCFSCTKDAHMPIDCDGLTTWQDRINQGDDDTNNWLKINTKPCPKCKRPIEKNSGCMHMTCSQCKYEFCWLCMGDYRNHSAETGQGLCNSFEDVKKAGRDTGEISDIAKIERELKRLEHYSMRYIEHQKSIAHAARQVELLKLQVAQALDLNSRYSPNDYQFLIDIAQLVVAARRSLSYTYAIRFFLRGANKQAFFDFIQGDMEKSLEALNKRMEENWLNNVEYDTQGRMILSTKFFRYKECINSLREVVERHFNTVMKEIMNGLPSITEDVEDGADHTFDGGNVGTHWTCRVCQVKNQINQPKCSTCKTAKPNLTFAAAGNRTNGISIGGSKKKR